MHFAHAEVDRLSETILHYLEHEQERTEITSQAHTLMQSDLTLAASLESMLSACAGEPRAVQPSAP